jgi:predicted phosphodiesterase
MKRDAFSTISRRQALKTAGALLAGSGMGLLHSQASAEEESSDLPPVLLPYLQNPAPDGMTVLFLARDATKVSIAWAVEGAKSLSNIDAESIAIPGTPWTRWRVRLKGLRPGTTYRYQVRYTIGSTESKTEVYPFTTFDPQADEAKLAIFNDIHDRKETISALMKHVKPEDFDASIFNGDMINDPSASNGARQAITLWNFYVELLQGYSKPILFVRGNHEVRGSFCKHLHYLFELPSLTFDQAPEDQQWQYELTMGPVHFLMMDTGEDDDLDTPEDSYKRPKFWQAYRLRQKQWLEQRLAARSGANKPWRVFVSHIPLHNPAGWFSITSRDGWLAELTKYGLSLMLAGHDHSWKFLSNDKSFAIKGTKDEDKPTFPVLIAGGPSLPEGTVILLHGTTRALRARMYSCEGKLLHSFHDSRPLRS